MSLLIEQLITYLRDVLNVTLVVQPWGESGRLPFFLQDSYTYYHTDLYGLQLLLMVDNGDEEHSPATVRKHIDLVREKHVGEVIYVGGRVTASNRRRLIEQNVPFIVPGNQLYCPLLAIDLREHFRQRRKKVHVFSPATQALALYWIYNHNDKNDERGSPTEMAKVLGYSKMTMSRAFQEVDVALEEVFADKWRRGEIKQEIKGKELWLALQPYWRSPVNQRYYLPRNDMDRSLGVRAGLSALAGYSMLAESSREVFAVSQSEWKVFRQKSQSIVFDRPDALTFEMEVWAYSPHLLSQQGNLADPLSLYLSLQESKDERIQSALDELLEGVKW
ncbi:MAG: hypothetical protein PHI97_22775 [Desulfobulbus sp.]|nr:hypothetical protein [Desulfobulbus sp.]